MQRQPPPRWLAAVKAAVTPGLALSAPQWGAVRGHQRHSSKLHRLACVKALVAADGKVERMFVQHMFTADPQQIKFAQFLLKHRKAHGFKEVSVKWDEGNIASAEAAGLRPFTGGGSTEGATLCLPEDFNLDQISEWEQVLCIAAARDMEQAEGVVWV